jgi:CheY-like chemotaxis protein
MVEAQQCVCIIDDESSLIEIYQTKFESEGYYVITAQNGEEGLQLIREYHPDIVLLDLQMPVKSGLEVIKDMKKDDEIRNIPIVILSNVDDMDMFRQVGKLEHTNFYLIKSLTTPQKAVDIVREVLH